MLFLLMLFFINAKAFPGLREVNGANQNCADQNYADQNFSGQIFYFDVLQEGCNASFLRAIKYLIYPVTNISITNTQSEKKITEDISVNLLSDYRKAINVEKHIATYDTLDQIIARLNEQLQAANERVNALICDNVRYDLDYNDKYNNSVVPVILSKLGQIELELAQDGQVVNCRNNYPNKLIMLVGKISVEKLRDVPMFTRSNLAQCVYEYYRPGNSNIIQSLGVMDKSNENASNFPMQTDCETENIVAAPKFDNAYITQLNNVAQTQSIQVQDINQVSMVNNMQPNNALPSNCVSDRNNMIPIIELIHDNQIEENSAQFEEIKFDECKGSTNIVPNNSIMIDSTSNSFASVKQIEATVGQSDTKSAIPAVPTIPVSSIFESVILVSNIPSEHKNEANVQQTIPTDTLIVLPSAVLPSMILPQALVQKNMQLQDTNFANTSSVNGQNIRVDNNIPNATLTTLPQTLVQKNVQSQDISSVNCQDAMTDNNVSAVLSAPSQMLASKNVQSQNANAINTNFTNISSANTIFVSGQNTIANNNNASNATSFMLPVLLVPKNMQSQDISSVSSQARANNASNTVFSGNLQQVSQRICNPTIATRARSIPVVVSGRNKQFSSSQSSSNQSFSNNLNAQNSPIAPNVASSTSIVNVPAHTNTANILTTNILTDNVGIHAQDDLLMNNSSNNLLGNLSNNLSFGTRKRSVSFAEKLIVESKEPQEQSQGQSQGQTQGEFVNHALVSYQFPSIFSSADIVNNGLKKEKK